MQHIISYNEREVIQEGRKEDAKTGYNIWIDLVDPTPAELSDIQNTYQLNKKAIEHYENMAKKPQIRILDAHSFTVILDIRFKDAKTLETEGIYMFLGRGWLVTIHSEKVDLKSVVLNLFEEKNRPIMELPVDALYHSIIAHLVDSYEQLLTALELAIIDFGQKSLYKPTRKMLEYLDILARQVIVLRRHFWHTRDIINFLVNTDKDEEDVRYLKIVNDDINQLIEMVESYRDSINSTRELYVANVSLQLNDTVKTLTLFSVILLPLTFISSVYGMNGFDLNNIWSVPSGFALVLIMMGVVSAIVFAFFKQKGWILTKKDEEKFDHHVVSNGGKDKGKDKEKKGAKDARQADAA